MMIGKIYKSFATLSPYIEIMLRILYWRNYNVFGKLNPNSWKKEHGIKKIDFTKILNWFSEQGVTEGSLIIVHSSYDSLKECGLSPNEINRKLKELIGESGTLAMPAIRKYKNFPPTNETLYVDISNIINTYHPRKTPVVSGLLPSMLLRDKNAVISKHPLNPMVAVGPLAKHMMENNIEGDCPSPHGPNSSWKYCADHDAVIISLGINMAHHLTMVHVNEENDKEWPYKDWYHKLTFEIVNDNNEIITKTVKDRKPQWGLLYDAELNMERDLYMNNIIKTTYIDGVEISITKAKTLISFLKSNKHSGYPYYKLF